MPHFSPGRGQFAFLRSRVFHLLPLYFPFALERKIKNGDNKLAQAVIQFFMRKKHNWGETSSFSLSHKQRRSLLLPAFPASV